MGRVKHLAALAVITAISSATALADWAETPPGSDNYTLSGSSTAPLTVPEAASGSQVIIEPSGDLAVGIPASPSTADHAIKVEAAGYTVTNNGSISFTTSANPPEAAAAIGFADSSGSLIDGTVELGTGSAIVVAPDAASTTRTTGISGRSITCLNGFNGSIDTTGNGNNSAYGLLATDDSTINGGVGGTVNTVNIGAAWALGLYTRNGSLNVGGDIAGRVSAETGPYAATAIYGGEGIDLATVSGTVEAGSEGQTMGMQIWGYINQSNSISIDHLTSTGQITAIGGDNDWNVSGLEASANGNVTIGQLDGTIYAETRGTDGSVWGVYAVGRNDPGLDPSLGGNVTMHIGPTGVIEARGGSQAAAIMGYNGIDVTIQGTVLAESLPGGQTWAIYSGKTTRNDPARFGDDLFWSVADDSVTLDGASVTGDIDLTGGTNTVSVTGGTSELVGDIVASTGTTRQGDTEYGTLDVQVDAGATLQMQYDGDPGIRAETLSVENGGTLRIVLTDDIVGTRGKYYLLDYNNGSGPTEWGDVEVTNGYWRGGPFGLILAVPEPATLGLFAFGLLTLARRPRRRRNKTRPM